VTETTADLELEAATEEIVDEPETGAAIDAGSEAILMDPGLLEEQENLSDRIALLEARLEAVTKSRAEAEKEVQLRFQQESDFRTEAAARRHEDEEARKRAEEKAARRRYEDERYLATEHLARVRAEEELQALTLEQERLRIESVSLRTSAVDIARKISQIENAQREVAEKAERENAARLLAEATAQHIAELERLRTEEESLSQAVALAATQRAEMETTRRQAEVEIEQLAAEKQKLQEAESACLAEAARLGELERSTREVQQELAQREEQLRLMTESFVGRRAELASAESRAAEEDAELAEIEARTHTAEESRRQLQAERMRLESEIRERADAEQLLLEEIRRRAVEEQERLEEAVRLRVVEQERHQSELAALRQKLEVEARGRAEQEIQALAEVESLRTTGADLLRRIEEAENQRRAAEERHRLATKKIQKLEAEAHLRQLEEERALARLEEVSKSVAQQAQSRIEQEKRIKEEIEGLRRSELEVRQRIEEEMRQRAAAEVRLHQEKERLHTTQEARARVEAQTEAVSSRPEPVAAAWRDDPAVNLRRSPEPQSGRVTLALRAEAARSLHEQHVRPIETEAAEEVPDAVMAKLSSSDEEQRAEGLADLSKLEAKSVFEIVVNYFDDTSALVRNAAARTLHALEPLRPAELFTQALEEASAERKRNIGGAIATSGLANEALNNLDADSRDDTYNALCLLFVMAKTGEVTPLVRAVEEHPDVEVRRAAIKLLNLSGQSEIADAAAKRRLNQRR
jgi:hypothetical protein